MAELLLVLFEEPTMLLNHVLCYTSHTLQNTFLNLITQNVDILLNYASRFLSFIYRLSTEGTKSRTAYP